MTEPIGQRTFLIYGAYGYTGELIARAAVARGLRPILAGRSPEPLSRLADELDLEARTFQLESRAILDQRLADVDAVLHCAGPFQTTVRPMTEACLRTNTHYLDITGEIDVFESLARRDPEAKEAGIVILPGVGFDVVATDCLAQALAARLATANRLELAIEGLTRMSRGTATTMVEGLGEGGRIRRGGELVQVPLGHETREIDFGDGPRRCLAIPFGDVSTAFHTTGIPNITVFAAMTASQRLGVLLSRKLGWLLRSRPARAFLRSRARKGAPGPTEKQRLAGRSRVWGQVEDAQGNRVVGRLRATEPYAFTVDAALACLDRVLADQVPPGFHTPARALGPDGIAELPGVRLELPDSQAP